MKKVEFNDDIILARFASTRCSSCENLACSFPMAPASISWFLSIVSSKLGLSGNPSKVCVEKTITSLKPEVQKCNLDPPGILRGNGSESIFKHNTSTTKTTASANSQGKMVHRWNPINSLTTFFTYAGY